MERQLSYGSESSMGSAFSGRSAGGRGGKDQGKGAAEELEQKEQLMKALFGALYTLAKEKINDSAGMAYLTIFIDFILICCLFLMPEYPWAADEHHPIFKVFFYIEFHLPIAHTGYRFYLIIFYVLVATLFTSVGICVWVGWCFKNDSFPFLWPIKVARIVVSLFVSMFYIASLNIFLIALQCKPEEDAAGKTHWVHLIYHLDCLSMPHVVHAAFSMVSSILFFVVALLLVVADHDLEPMSRSLLAAPHSMTELRMLLCKTAITVADILLRPAPHYQVTVYAVACVLMLWYHFRWAPHLNAWINCLRAGLHCILAWISVTLMAMTFSVEWIEDVKAGSHAHFTWEPWNQRYIWTMLMAGGVPVVFFGGMALMYARIYYSWRTALNFARLEPGIKPRSLHTFWDDFDVEVSARFGRIYDAEGANYDPGALDVAENVLKAGVALFPDSPYLRIVYSNFLIEVRKNNSAGWAQLEMARKFEPNLSFQFSIFTREQEHKQKAAAGSSGEQAVDLVSYVEFQKNYRSLLEYHKAALEAARDFWRLIMKDVVPVAAMSRMFARIDMMEVAANRTYRLVLDRYPKSAKLLRSYGKFLENVKNDPWSAAKYYAEAEKQEELAESAAPEIKLAAGDEGEPNVRLLAALTDKDNAIITANATGVIQMANKPAQKLLGYQKGELEGKNVNILMPPPYSTRHIGYMRAYQNTGQSHIVDQVTELVALHKARFIIPITLMVSKASGSGADATFMAVIKPAQSLPDEIKAWLLPNGSVLCVDQSFMDYAGWGPLELVGKAFSSLAADPVEVDSMVGQASKCSLLELKQGAVVGRALIKHKYGGEVGVALRFDMGGSEAHRLLVVSMRRLDEPRIMLAVNHKGRLEYANTALATLLGYKLSVLRAKEFSALLPQPFNIMHSKWLKEADTMNARLSPGSCRNSSTVHMLGANGIPVPVKATIVHQPGNLGQGATWAVTFNRSSEAAAADERRLQLRLNMDGTIVGVSRNMAPLLFGLDPGRLVGQRLDAVVDVFHEYAKTGGTLKLALTALLMRSHTVPGSSWRVGVGRVEEAEAEVQAAVAAARGAGSMPRSIIRQASRQAGSKVKAAVMMVAVARTQEEDVLNGAEQQGKDRVLDGGTARDQEDGAAVVLELWRSELLSGVVELGLGCSIIRADAGAGRIFGVAPALLLQHNLLKYITLPSNTTLEDLMGMTSAKKGGMKKASAHKVGPKRQLNGVHTDGRSLRVHLQAVLKDGSSLHRVVTQVKINQPCQGEPHMMENLVAAMQQAAAPGEPRTRGEEVKSPGGSNSGEVADDQGPQDELQEEGSEEGGGAGAGRSRQVPGLPLADVARLGPDGGPGNSRARGTGRSRLSGRSWGQEPATARGVTLDIEGGEEEGDNGDAGDGGRGRRGMDVSDSGSGGAEVGKARAKKHMTDEEREAEMAAKGSRKARAWLESGFHHTAEADEEVNLPGAVRAREDERQGGSGKSSGEREAAEARGARAGGAVLTEDAGPAHSQSDITSGAGDATHLVGDFARGKRLRKLLRLLQSHVTLRATSVFKQRMLAMSAVVVLLHVIAFVSIMISLRNEDTYTSELHASGTVIAALHRACSYARVIEAAQRDYGYSPSDMAAYGALLNDQLDKLEALHQGLYLGFNGLRTIDTPAIHSLWHDPLLSIKTFDGADSGGANTTMADSLFNVGGQLITAGREVVFVATSGSTTPLGQNGNWRFMMENGPTQMYPAYLHSLNLMALRAQNSVSSLRTLIIVLLGVEGAGVCAGSVTVVLLVLRALMRHRMAFFSVFLAIPNTALRTLASKSTNIGEEEEESDDEEAREAENEAEKKKKARQLAEEEEAEKTAGGDSGEGEALKGAGGASATRRRVSIVGKEGNTGDLGAASKGGYNLATLMSVDLRARQEMLFNGKKLDSSASDLYKLLWPFLMWGALIVVMYGISYMAFDAIQMGIISVKLGQRDLVQASRVIYYSGEVSLAATAAERAGMQPVLAGEARLLDDIHSVHLYGGPTLPDSVQDGSRDESPGSLFISPEYADLLFRVDACMREDASGCADETSPFYAIAHASIDPMLRRLVEEASLLALDNPNDIVPDSRNSRYAYIWTIGNWDLHDGIQSLTKLYAAGLSKGFKQEQAVHIVLLAVVVVMILAFVMAMLRPFLAQVGKEGRRVAELLVQLPTEIDLETLITALTHADDDHGNDRGANRQAVVGVWGQPMLPGAGMPAPQVGMQFQDGSSSMPAYGGEGGRIFSPRMQPDPNGPQVLRHAAGDLGGVDLRRRQGASRRVAPE